MKCVSANNYLIKFRCGVLLVLFCVSLSAQNNTFSPYSRYGLGEIASPLPAHLNGMGGTFIGFKADTAMPIFLNTGNPASYSLLRLSALEVGGRFMITDLSSSRSETRKWSTNFSYATMGMPIGQRGGLAFGLTPYSFVGYDSESAEATDIGNITSRYSGSGGLSRAFLGYGIQPFQQRWIRFRRRQSARPDSVAPLSAAAFRRKSFANRFLSDLSIGANAQYYFGSIYNTTRLIFPNSGLYNNTYFENTLDVRDFSGNIGIQGAFTIDSIGRGTQRRALKEQVKFTFGFVSNLRTPLRAYYNDIAYNYIVNATGAEVVRDTLLFAVDQRKYITLPAEQGVGFGFKKGERLNVVADAAVTGWSLFRYPGNPATLTDSYRLSFGVNFVPEKYAAGRGAFLRRINYRLGGSRETGFVKIKGQQISNSYVSAGIGIPVGIGRLSSMVHLSGQIGQAGTLNAGLLKEYYGRIYFGFTFCDRWFQKFRYD